MSCDYLKFISIKMVVDKVLLLVALVLCVKSQRTQDWISDVQCSPHYHFQGNLEKISISFSQLDGPASSYDVIYSDSATGITCELNTLPASICDSGDKICNHLFNVSNSSCSSFISINVTISVTISGIMFTSKPTKIDSVNKFINVSFDKKHSSIRCQFLNQPKTIEKSCIVKYGRVTSAGCDDLSSQTAGYLINSNAISLELDLTSKICFILIATGSNTTVNVEGIYDDLSSNIVPDGLSLNGSLLILGIFLSLCFIIYLIWHHFFASESQPVGPEGESYVQDDSTTGELDLDYSFPKTAEDVLKQDQLLIDESITSHKLWDVHKKCLMHEFASEHYPGYEPREGYGYFQVTDVKSIQDHKKVILMDEEIPRYIAYLSTIKQQIIEGWKQIYAQDNSYTRVLDPGSKFLFCARSKSVTAYSRVCDVTKECKQSEFTLDNIPGYRTDWMQYCYFQLTKPEYIQPHQHLIVMKTDGKLFLGPGIRHLVGTGDGSKLTPKPDLSKFPKWKHVFVQSRHFDRNLIPGTKYLFCAKMDRVRAHFSIYNIKEKCNMAEFGRHHIPGFKPEYGYGYFQFTEDEYFKPHKKVILVRKDKKLYTGAGAQFVCADGRYDKEIIQREKKISPPKLNGTEWKHIFIQSHSKNRELLPGTKFLYCEYKTYK